MEPFPEDADPLSRAVGPAAPVRAIAATVAAMPFHGDAPRPGTPRRLAVGGHAGLAVFDVPAGRPGRLSTC